MSFIILRKHEETLKPSSLPSKQQFVYFAREDKEKWIFSMRIKWVEQAVPVFIKVQQYPISHKKSEFRIKTVDCWYGYTEAFKIAHAC